MNSEFSYNSLTKAYSTNIRIDKVLGGQYDTNSPHSTTLHRHNFYQIVWISNGEGEHVVEQNKFRYKKGSVFLLAPHFMHQIQYGSDVNGFVISFSDTFLDKLQYELTLLFYNLNNCMINVPSSDLEMFNKEMEHLHYNYAMTALADKNIILQNYIHILIIKLKNYALESGNQSSVLDGDKFMLAEQFISLVRNHFRKEKALDFYLDRLAVSQRKLNDVIGAVTKLTPAKFIEQYSLNEAARLICFSNDNLKEIAAWVGYFDSSYFAKAFKKHFGKSPLQYRKDYLKEHA
jgi:AraC-like DNA-binding protein